MPLVPHDRLSYFIAALSCAAASACGHDPAVVGNPAEAAVSSGSEAGAEAVSPAPTGLPDSSGTPPGPALGGDAALDGGGGGSNGDVSDAMQPPVPAAEAGTGSVTWACPAGPFGTPIPAGATPVRVAGVPPSDGFNMNNGTFGIIEGPAWIGDALYVSEIATGPSPPASRILKITPAGAVSVAVPNSGTNGLAVDRRGNLYGAVHKDGSVSRFDLSTGTATPIASTFMGARFDSPNDLAIRSDGTIYFSDPDYQAPSMRPQLKTRVYRIAAGTNAVGVVDATLNEPNGVTLSLDESVLFVTTPGAVYKYPVMADGSVGVGSVIMPTVSGGDGMTLDCAGNLYVATPTSVVVLSPSGTELGRIAVAGGAGSATNVAFGGADHKTLYVTALGSGPQKGLFQVTLGIPGFPY